MRFKDKVVAITGGSRGLGAALAYRFADEGADISICARNVELMKEVTSEIEGKGRQALFVKADVTDREDVNKYAGETLEKFGHVDILVNNAGALAFADFMSTTDEIWDFMMEANLNSARRVTQAILPSMLDRGSGKVIFISSNTAKRAFINDGAYACAKAGMLQMAKTLAQEVGTRGIDVFCFCPGLIAETDLGDAVVVDHANDPDRPFGGDVDAFWEWANTLSSKGQHPTLKQIVDVTTFLASDEGTVLHGTLLSGDHGMTDW
jgi:NAD(P)-dependent dehydrogenase (short-subunit alcohol dehydrogenase family)